MISCNNSPDKKSYNMDEIEDIVIEESNIYRRISSGRAKEIIERLSNQEYTIVDVRQKEEYEIGHIEGTVLLPLDKLEDGYEKVLDFGGIIEWTYELVK